MRIIIRFFTLSLLMLITLNSMGQINIRFVSGEKKEYSLGDELAAKIQLNVDPNSCKDGMEKTLIFASGIEITSRSEWIELKKGLWETSIKCKIIGNKRGLGQLTVIRKTDKQDLFAQEKLMIRKDANGK